MSFMRFAGTRCLLSAYILYIFLRDYASYKRAAPTYPPHNNFWNEYRIGDAVSRKFDAPGCERFPDTIACLYLKHTDSANDIGVLISVIDTVQDALKCKTAPKDVVVMHLRLGDGLCAQYDKPCRGARVTRPSCWDSDNDCFNNPSSETKQYAFSRRWYEKVLATVIEQNYTKVVLVTDTEHWTRTPDPRRGDHSVDVEYIQNVIRYFSSEFVQVSLKETGEPDEDFIYMASARHFIRGGGGYSRLVSDVVQARGGDILIPSP